MPFLLLIRHGDNDHLRKKILYARLPGVHLNTQGRQQAELLAAALADVPLTAIYASPLERAVETAQPIAARAGLEVHTDARLLDTDIGNWQGQPWKTMTRSPFWNIIQSTPGRFRFPGGESFLETQARVVTALEQIISACQPKDWVAVVFHADPIKLAVAHYIGLPLDHFQRLACDTGSVTTLGVGEHGVRLIGLNQRPPFALPDLKVRRR
jgi:broad specificity phosphatase PhoE